jgi:DNA-binding SARP family transcriptional activator
MMGTLEIRLFGNLSIERDGQQLPRLPSKRVRHLLSYLLLNGDTFHSREHLAGLFWGDRDDRQARHCLNTTLWRLQTVLGQPAGPGQPYLRADAQSIGFNAASDIRIDAIEFESRCRLADQVGAASPAEQAAFYRQAVGLYRGDLLPDCYEDWCLVERERFQRLYLRALARLLSYHAKRQEWSQAIECAARILECDPLREEIHRDLIGLYLSSGQPAAALRQYQTCAAILRRELGIDPMPETQRLLGGIMGAAGSIAAGGLAAVAPAPPARPAVTPAEEIGRAAERLREAVTVFERVCGQLGEITGILEELAAGLHASQPPAARERGRGPAAATASPPAAPEAQRIVSLKSPVRPTPPARRVASGAGR